MPIRRGTRRFVFVGIEGMKDFRYGWKTNVSESVSEELGHKNLTANVVDVNNLAVTPKSPTPAFAVKTTSTGSTSSYVDKDKIGDARSAGYLIQPPKFSIPSGNNSRTLVVEINKMKFVWVRPNEAGDETDFKVLGVSDADITDVFQVVSANWPRPPRMEQPHPSGGTVSTFADPTKLSDAANAGWKKADSGRYTLATLRALGIG